MIPSGTCQAQRKPLRNDNFLFYIFILLMILCLQAIASTIEGRLSTQRIQMYGFSRSHWRDRAGSRVSIFSGSNLTLTFFGNSKRSCSGLKQEKKCFSEVLRKKIINNVNENNSVLILFGCPVHFQGHCDNLVPE